MTAPLVPADTDLRDFHFMPLDVVRLVDSDLTAIASGDEFKAAILLWCKSWHQVPCSSLPNDDRMLAHLAGYGRDLKAWRRVKEVAVRGFILCSDGRLYHPVIAEKALEAASSKAVHAAERKGDQDRKKREREERSQMFADLRAAGITTKWNTSTSDLRRLVTDLSQRTAVTGHEPVTPPVTARTGTGTQTGTVEEKRPRARDPDLDLERELRKAAGWQNSTYPKLAITGAIQALLDNGADLTLDVLPIIRAKASKCRHPNWQFFVADIAEQRDRRLAAGTIKTVPALAAGNPNGTHRQPPARDTFAVLEQSLAEQRARASGEAGGGPAGSEDHRDALPGVRKGSA